MWIERLSCSDTRHALLDAGEWDWILIRFALWHNDSCLALGLLRRLTSGTASLSLHQQWWAVAALALLEASHSGDSFPPHDRGDPLFKLLQLTHRQPSVESAAQLVDFLSEDSDSLDIVQQTVIRQLLDRSLTYRTSWSTAEFSQAAAVCQRIPRRRWAPSCVQTTLALHGFSTAAPHDLPRTVDETLGAQARWVNRAWMLLTGNPRCPDSQDLTSALSACEHAMHGLLTALEVPSTAELIDIGNRLCDAAASEEFKHFPTLQNIAIVLAQCASSGCRTNVPCDRSVNLSQLPDWATWLHTRVSLMHSETDWTQHSVQSLLMASTIALWSTHSRLESFERPAEQAVTERLKQFEQELSNEEQIGWKKFSASWDGDAAEPLLLRLLTSAGGLVKQIVEQEQQLADREWQLRQQLRNRDWLQASAAARRELRSLSEKAPLLEWSWRSRFHYWLSIAEAHRDVENAAGLFSETQTGISPSRVLIQRSMLAIRHGEYQHAEEILRSCPNRNSMHTYALAVLSSHQGNDAQALKLLTACDLPEDACEWQPIRRLQAAIFERMGRDCEAVDVYREHLSQFPQDGIAAARFARLLFRRFTEDGPQLRAAGLMEIVKLTRQAADVSWSPPLQEIAMLLQNPQLSLPAPSSTVVTVVKQLLQAIDCLERGERTRAEHLLTDAGVPP